MCVFMRVRVCVVTMCMLAVKGVVVISVRVMGWWGDGVMG